MNIKQLIAVSVRQPNIGNVEIIDWAVQRIQDLEQENKELKAHNAELQHYNVGLAESEFSLKQERDQLKYHLVKCKPNSDWISVEDRLPEKQGYVLVACEGGNVDVSFYSENDLFLAASKSAGQYSRKACGKLSRYFEIAHRYGYRITHWQPRPEPPMDTPITGVR